MSIQIKANKKEEEEEEKIVSQYDSKEIKICWI